MDNVVSRLSDKSFNKFITGNGKALVMFWGSWCPVCKQAERMLSLFVKEVSIPVGVVNVDKSPHTASTYQVMGTPTYCMFYKGVVSWRVVGSHSRDQLKKLVKGDC